MGDDLNESVVPGEAPEPCAAARGVSRWERRADAVAARPGRRRADGGDVRRAAQQGHDRQPQHQGTETGQLQLN